MRWYWMLSNKACVVLADTLNKHIGGGAGGVEGTQAPRMTGLGAPCTLGPQL